MKMVQVHNRYRFGGGENIMFEAISRLLSQKGHKVSLFERSSLNLQGVWGRIHAFGEGIYSRSAKKALSAILASERPNVVHVHNLYPLISPSVLVACREFDVPVVMSCHNYRLICPTSMHFNGIEVCERCHGEREYWCVLKNCRGDIFESVAYGLRSAVARKFRLFKDNVTLLIALTEFLKGRLVAAGFKKERIVVIPNMVSIPDSPTDSSAGEYVAYAGRISTEKGIDTLLVAARHSGLPVHIAGDGPTRPQLVEKAPKNAEFVGRLDRAEITSFYRKARITVVPSLCFETFGLTAAEAMSHGLPVIASRIGGLPEIVEDGVTGLLSEPGNVEDLAQKMKLLWENPDLCRKMGLAGREKSIREYSEDVYYERLMAVYNKAIKINKVGRQGLSK